MPMEIKGLTPFQGQVSKGQKSTANRAQTTEFEIQPVSAVRNNQQTPKDIENQSRQNSQKEQKNNDSRQPLSKLDSFTEEFATVQANTIIKTLKANFSDQGNGLNDEQSSKVERMNSSAKEVRARYAYEDVESMNFSRPIRIGLDIMA